MKIMIDKSFFNNQKYLIIQNSEFSWCSKKQESVDLFLDIGKSNSLNDYFEIHGLDRLEFLEKKYLDMMQAVSSSNPPWKEVLPYRIYSEKMSKLQIFLDEAKSLSNKKYSKVFSSGNEVLHNLSTFKIEESVLGTKIENPTVRKILSSFSPKEDGFTSHLTYDRLKTVTGRLVVKSGPQVLLLPRGSKNIFKSRYEDGSIVWVDYVSLEPRLAKLLKSKTTKVDIYSDIIKEYDLSHDRKTIKAAVLSTLFGAGISKLTEIVGKEAFLIKKSIEDYFDLKSILDSAGDFKSGKIYNHFGRPINLKKKTSNVAVNNFIQSSGVDVSLVGFSNLMKKFPDSVKSLAVIHDALVLDVHKDELASVKEIVKEGIEISDLGHFYLECS